MQQETLYDIEVDFSPPKGDRFISTPAGQDSNLSTQYTPNLSAMVQENLRAAGWPGREHLTRSELDRKMQAQEQKYCKDLDARDSSLHQHINDKFDAMKKTLSDMLDEKFCHLRPPKTVIVNNDDDLGSNNYPGFDEQWSAAAAAAAGTGKLTGGPSLFPRIASPPLTTWFGSSSPTGTSVAELWI